MHADPAAKLQKDRDFEREALPWLPHVTRYALSLTSKDDDADDLVQETSGRMCWLRSVPKVSVPLR